MLTQLEPGSPLYGLAADRDQGRLLTDPIAGFVARTPELGSALDVGSSRVSAPRIDIVLEIFAADVAVAYGLRPAFLIVDELAQWATTAQPRALWEATAFPPKERDQPPMHFAPVIPGQQPDERRHGRHERASRD